MSFLHLSTGILDHSSFANCSRSFIFEGCLLPTAVLRSLHRCSMRFRSGLIAGHFRTLQCFVCNHFWVLFEVFRVIVLPEDPWPLVETQLSDTGHYVAPQNSLVIIRFHDTVHTVKASSARSSKATPKHLWTSTMFDCKDCVLFFEGLISFSVNSAMMSFTKKHYFCLICPQYVLPERLWFCHISFGKLQSCFFYAFVSAVVSSWVSYHSPSHSDGDG